MASFIRISTLLVVGGAISTVACTSIEPLRPDMASRVLPSRLDEIAYINSLREAFEFTRPTADGCYRGEILRYFRAQLGQGYPDHDAEQEGRAAGLVGLCVRYRDVPEASHKQQLTRYLEAGFGLTDLYCQRFFIVASESSQKRRFQRNSFSAVDTLVNAVLGVGGAGETALAIANAGFQAADATYQNIEDAFLVAPDLANVRDLVHAAQQDYRTRAFQSTALPRSYESARAVIERYAGLCSYTGMRQLVNDSVTSETRTLNRQAEAQRGNGQPVVAAPVAPVQPATPSPVSATDASVSVPATPPPQT